MVEREILRVSWDEESADVAIKTNPKGVCVIEFSDRLPEDLIKILESPDLAVHSISGRDPGQYQLFTRDIAAEDVRRLIDDWGERVEKEGYIVRQVDLSEASQE